MTDTSFQPQSDVPAKPVAKTLGQTPSIGADKNAPIVVCDDCFRYLSHVPAGTPRFDLTFMDPPFNQGKDYRQHNDSLSEAEYWGWMSDTCRLILEHSTDGAAIYFMQREKNAEFVLRALRTSGWTFQNLVIWKKKTSAIPGTARFGKAHQIIAFATKGPKPRTFNRLRIDPPLPEGYKPRPNGMFVTDIWDDIRELTSGYYAGDETLRDSKGERVHKQQSPISLLLRIILSSSGPGNVIFDPFLGSGTTNVVASQLDRKSIGVEIDPLNVNVIEERLSIIRDADNVERLLTDYRFTDQFESLVGKALPKVVTTE